MPGSNHIYNIAHRGARSLAPENTMPAFVKAWQTGAHGVETDVSVTSDGQLILLHDVTFMRTTNIAEVFPDRTNDPSHTFTWEEIQRLDAGSWFIEVDPFETIKNGKVTTEEQQEMINTSVPLLEELLIFVKEKSLFINVEIKWLPEAIGTFPIVENILSLIDRVRLPPDMFSISSFNHLYLKKVAELRPDIEVNALIGGFPPLKNDWGNFEFSVYNASANIVDSKQIEKALQHGCRVNLFTVNNAKDMARFRKEGVDKIITDFPQLLAQLDTEKFVDRPQKSKSANFAKTKVKAGYIWPDWYQTMKKFRASNSLKASWQIINTIIPYFFLWYLMIRSIQLGYPYILTLFITLAAAAFLVRMFILFHDCAHYSLFTSKKTNIFFGSFLSVLLFMSFKDWRFTHLKHHGDYANLDSRGYGDIWTMTKKEYESVSTMQRLRYRLYRNPLVMLGLGVFLLSKRPSYFMVKPKERMDILFTYLFIAAVALVASKLIGWPIYLVIQVPVLWFAGGVGVWLFYVHHQFEGGYWARRSDWNALSAAMEGSSFLKLPAVLNWFTSNIGYHHIHHVDPAIPNYHLKKCYNAIPALQAKTPLTLTKSLACYRLKLWDEDLRKMVVFP